MTESKNTETLNDETQTLSFGEHLYVERKRQNLNAAEVAAAIHLSEAVIDAIDHSDISQLPDPTFVQGYLRAYAKYLGISDVLVLEEYSHSVPHKLESDLQRRSTLPGEASSNTPSVKIITIFLLLVTVLAALYASFDYYKTAIETDVPESSTTGSLDIPESTEDPSDDSYSVEMQEKINLPDLSPETVEQQTVASDVKQVSSKVIAEQDKTDEIQEKARPVDVGATNDVLIEGKDTIDLLAEQVSWVEVTDAGGVVLYYDLMQQDQYLTFKGAAPFKVFLGNAPQVKVKINDIDVNIQKYIRSDKNTAYFKISVDQQQVVFH